MSPTVRATIVGRERQREAALQAVADAAKGAGSIVVVRGVAGIGKTRFLESVRDGARAFGVVTAAAANYSAVRAPFGPFGDLVDELRPACPDLIPSGVAERSLFERFFGTSVDGTDPNVDRRKLFVVLADALTRAAQRTPLFIAIDDAQWADPESVEFLHYWAARAGRTRVVTFVAIRDEDEDGPAGDLAISLARFERVSTIELLPLDDRFARELIAFTLPPGRSLPGRTTDEICRLAEGNPLFLAELVHVALESEGHLSLPRNVELATRKRLRSIDAGCARTIEIAAALGRTFALDDLAAVASITRSDALQALRQARDLALLDEDPSTPAQFVFRHELLRTAIYETMFAAERGAVHKNIAQAFELKSAPAEVLADHWRRAGEAKRAAAHAERAGDAALALGAHASARDRFLDILGTQTRGANRARICEKLAIVSGALGDTRMARSRLIEAIEYQRRFGTEVKLAELECDHAGLAYRCGDVDGAIGAAIRVIENPAATSNQTFKARVSLALYFAYRGDINEARNHLDHADRMRDGRSSIEELRLEWARATVAMEGTDSERWREPALRSLKLAEEHASPALLAFTSMNFAGMASECGRRDLASTALRRAIAVADENGLTLASAYARCAAIAELHARGSLREAESMIRDVIALQVDATVARIFFASVSIPVLVDLGIAEHFKMLRDPSVLEIAFETGEQSRYVPAAAAFAYAEAMAGRTEGAHKFIDRALRGVTSARYIGGSLLTCARFGTSDHIATVWRLFEPEAGGRRNRPHLLLAEAIVARKSGDNARFREAVSNAITIAEREGLQPLVAYGLELQGRLNDARALYENCGAVAHVRRLSTKRSTSFTKREREIATLLRQGLSNRSISAKLVLSERTVENHIAAIYAKSGVRTRAEFLTASI